MSEPQTLADIEAEHGFVFGNPDSDKGDNAPAVAALICTNPTCGHRGQHVQIHADTNLPVHCGGCYAVLHCEHQPETSTVRAGTIGAPLEHTVTACTLCGSELDRATVQLPPIDLATLPLTVLDQPLG